MARQHRLVLGSRLAIGALVLGSLPLLLLSWGAPHTFEILLLSFITLPIFSALDLSRGGNLDRALIISFVGATGAILSSSFAAGHSLALLVWLPVIAVETVLLGSPRIRRPLLVAVLLLSAVALATGAQATSFAPSVAALVSALAALVYGAVLAGEKRERARMKIIAGRSMEARYSAFAEHITDVVACFTRNGSVLFLSPTAECLLRTDARQLSGRGMFERVHVADRPAFLTAISSANPTGSSDVLELRIKRPNGRNAAEFAWVEMRCRLIAATDDDSREHVLAIIRDVTERKNQESDLRIAREETEKASAARNRFLASMSHELRTPLNAIIGFSEMLSADGPAVLTRDRQKEYAGLIHDSGLHLLSVVNGILDMSRIESGNFSIVTEPFSVSPVVDSCMQLFALKAEQAGIDVSVEIARGLPELNADKRACKQILINLLSNAIKFTPQGGRVSVCVQVDRGAMRFDVTDTGVGVAANDIPMLGHAFFQARSSYDRPYEGTGLGLSVVKGLAELHGGSLEVQSRLGEGTQVTVRFPMAGTKAKPAQDVVGFADRADEMRKAVNG
ncbi:sensor histidine kinase [Flaviflagellibacter deserti]|uniref:histidine kinase n=1 Tax=Flaviflagellibacter deserti TaxID=2267266 RepID=A0ABV9YY26_9HYPH